MNCAECRDTMAAALEGLLEPELARQRQKHLAACEACRTEDAADRRLHERLLAGARSAPVSLVASVMREVQRDQAEKERKAIMIKSAIRWVLGIGTSAAAAILAVMFLMPSRAAATAERVLLRGAEAAANLSSVHLRGQVRTEPKDNFMAINPADDFTPIEFWWVWGPQASGTPNYGKWRAEKAGRVAVMDGQSTVLYIRPPANFAMKAAQPSLGAFDTGWLARIARLSETLTNELNNAKAKGWQITLAAKTGSDGLPKSIVTVMAKSGLPDNDYLKNKFFDQSDTRRVYQFDDGTARLEDMAVWLATDAGEVEVFDLTQIDYDQEIDPSVFHLDVPADAQWQQEPQILTDNQKYAALTAEQATRAFFAALRGSDWTEAAKFCPMPLNQQIRAAVAGLEIVSVGQAFTSQGNGASFVPYGIKFKSGEVQTNNLALKRDSKTGRWFVDGGF